jgi:uncharacterized protein
MSAVLVAIFVFLVGGALCWALAVALFAHGLTHPPRMTEGKAVYLLGRLSPADLGMEFEDVKFHISEVGSSNKLFLAGWWIPCDSSAKTVVMLHGFADAKIGAIAWSEPWRELGYNILAVDLRAHGESDGRLCTAGQLESSDILQLLDQLRAQHPDRAQRIVLFGVSLGAAVVAIVASQREDICAVVLDSPFSSYRDAVMTHAELLRQPAKLIAPAALSLVEKLTGARFDDIAPRRIVPRIKCPVLIIAGGKDSFFDPAAFDPRLVKIFPDAGHLLAYTSTPSEYRRTLKEFLNGI